MRRAVFEAVASGPRAVGEIARELPVSRPAVSQHLRVLKEAGLVVDERAGNRRLYRLNPAGVRELRAYVDRFWDLALAEFQEAAERAERKANEGNDR
jgi:DNA-binding transcriptional ArsR family regulator